MALQWNDSLVTGIAQVDEQHQELFRRINALLDASLQGKGKMEVGNTLDFLQVYVVTHFADEEALMARNQYPGLARHKELHNAFVADVNKVKETFEQDGASAVLVIMVQRQISQWLWDHIGQEDKALGEYMKQKKA
ncbi:MAG: bacteriohemerythrin [Mycobacterium leprae]